MGRPRVPRPKTSPISTVVTPEDHARLHRRVSHLGMSMGAWLRELINDDLEAHGEAPLIENPSSKLRQREAATV